MIKISALNEEYEEDSGSEEEVTREALEQIALQQYSKALDLQRKGNLSDAIKLLNDLLDTELLYEVKKLEPGEKVTSPLLNLKYLCYKNVANMLNQIGSVDAAIEAYCSATKLDDTDITLWYRLGQLCMKAKHYEMALQSFQRGLECNPRHWPCLDKAVTLLLGLDFKEECISTIYDAFKLDPDYLRGLVYRKHIFTVHKHVKEFMEYLNPVFKWNDKQEEMIDAVNGAKLLKEAEEISKSFKQQQKALQFNYTLPDLKLKKLIKELTWHAVGESLVHMHEYMTDNSFSHASYITILFEKEIVVQPMEVNEETNIEKKCELDDKLEEMNLEIEKHNEGASENENNEMSDKDKPTTDTEKVESDVEMVHLDQLSDGNQENKIQKKPPTRRRGSALSNLQQWEWCKNRRSGRKKAIKQEDENIYETLRRMIPVCLTSDAVLNKNKNQELSSSEDVNKPTKKKEQIDDRESIIYFGTEHEKKDVEKFINKYKETKHDIIDILKDYLYILALKWKIKWPSSLGKILIEANTCYNKHVDTPSCFNNNHEEILHYTTVNLFVQELIINEKFNSLTHDIQQYDLSVIDNIFLFLNLQPHVFDGTDSLEYVIRCLWTKVHIHLLNKNDEYALDSLYQLFHEFEAMGEYCDQYNLKLVNFTTKPDINMYEIKAYIQFLERNKRLSTVMESYERGNYEEVLSIVIDSYEHCKDTSRQQEEEMSLDFAVQLFLILESYWALGKVDDCLIWSFICLHEALKHYFRYTSGSEDYDKWTQTVFKILSCMEHVLTIEGLTCLDSVPLKDLSQGLEDLIRIIGHQVETTSTDMPFNTVLPWILMHYILQREEDKGRIKIPEEKDKIVSDEVPSPLMVLFIGHEQLGIKRWCCKNSGKLLYFILDVVCPKLRLPCLSKCLEQISQYMEQCVYCLFGHPTKKNNKLKYLIDHNSAPYPLDWKRAQQVYEIFRPPYLPALEGKVPGISSDTEQLFHRILQLLPSEYDPNKHISQVEKYIKGVDEKLSTFPSLLPYKMKDIYFLLGDYYFKKEEAKMAVKYNLLDVVVNRDRVESWAEISLAKAVNIERLLNSCKNLNGEREVLGPAKSVIRCFKRALQLDPTHCDLWVEYGMFVYTVHSFCSRALKQASESLSMDDFEALEKQKEDMLDITQKCIATVIQYLNNSTETDKEKEDDLWLYYYMLGKVAEKRKKAPSVYLNFYMKGIKSLEETFATYPTKINYSAPTHLSMEVLEMHYRIHASILKYIEQHENKPISRSVGKVFFTCIEQWKQGPFFKKYRKDGLDNDTEVKPSGIIVAANILKRSISDAGEEDNNEAKKLKLESAAAKVRRSASYDTEVTNQKESVSEMQSENSKIIVQNSQETSQERLTNTCGKKSYSVILSQEKIADDVPEKIEESSSSTSSSDSSSSDSSSDSSSESSRDSGVSKASNPSNRDSKPLSDEEVTVIIIACLDALEDCTSRFPQYYKAIYRLAHYHYYYKKGKDIERCRDLMLSNFTSRSGQKLAGLFSERKHSNFFNNIWKIPIPEVDRGGSFAFHMNRAVLLTMEILKEIDDHKSLLDLSLQLHRIPEPDKKYLRDSDREELSQQAYSLCIQSLKGQLTRFFQQADLKSNNIEREALKSLMLDIYKAYLRAQKQLNYKLLINLLVDAYKLVNITHVSDNLNLVDLSMKFCQSIIKQQVTDKQNAQKKQTSKVNDTNKGSSTNSNLKTDCNVIASNTSTSLPKMSDSEIAAAIQSYLPMLNDSLLSQQNTAQFSFSSYLNNISALAGYSSLQNTFSSLQSSQHSFQAEFFRQFYNPRLPLIPLPKKQKRGPKPTIRPTAVNVGPLKTSKPFITTSTSNTTMSTTTSMINPVQKVNSAPTMGSVLPISQTSTAASISVSTSTNKANSVAPTQAHMSTATTVTSAVTKLPMPHQQTSPGKTLQEKLAERQKGLPKGTSQEINASLNRLPSSLTITKTVVSKSSSNQNKKTEPKKHLPFNDGDVIVLDDD